MSHVSRSERERVIELCVAATCCCAMPWLGFVRRLGGWEAGQ